jgi:coproporphyrinogen III oxidase
VWEKAGVNVSVVYGSMPPSAYRAATERAQDIRPDAGRVPFFAAGISSVMHPHNPHAPTMHFNYRCVQHNQGIFRQHILTLQTVSVRLHIAEWLGFVLLVIQGHHDG